MEATFSPSDFWAKLKHVGRPAAGKERQSWHPLVAHSADVASVLEVLLRQTQLGRRMASLMGQHELSEAQIHRFCLLAALHDAGKANQGFQNRAFDADPQADHVRPIIGFLATIQKKKELTNLLDLKRLLPWFGNDWNEMFSWLQTTWSHHGAPVQATPPRKGLWTDRAKSRLSDVMAWAWAWYPEADTDAPPFSSPRQQHFFNGLLTLADWIGSDTSLFPMTPSLTDPDEALQVARQRAANAIEDLSLSPERNIDSSLSTILGGHEPYAIQTRVQNLSASREGSLTILESATGSGKTEGAVGRYARL
jgi:CRISPR-associated endonuclease/helicase Cas3